MFNLFGKKKDATTVSKGSSSKPANSTASIIKLRESIQGQEKREEHLERKIAGLVEEAKEKMAKKDKKGALFAMKRKKLYEGELEKIANVKMTLETQVMNLESATQNAETFKAMHEGKNAMQKIRTDVGIDKVDEMMDDIREEMEQANEIGNAMAQAVDPLVQDEDDLLKELEELEAQDVEQELTRPTPSQKNDLKLPQVPNSRLPTLEEDEAQELKKLEAELAGL